MFQFLLITQNLRARVRELLSVRPYTHASPFKHVCISETNSGAGKSQQASFCWGIAQNLDRVHPLKLPGHVPNFYLFLFIYTIFQEGDIFSSGCQSTIWPSVQMKKIHITCKQTNRYDIPKTRSNEFKNLKNISLL